MTNTLEDSSIQNIRSRIGAELKKQEENYKRKKERDKFILIEALEGFLRIDNNTATLKSLDVTLNIKFDKKTS
jgi:hypothetical protein